MIKINPAKVREVKILMGKSHMSRDFKEVCKAFAKEMANNGVQVECRILDDRDEAKIHDRYVVGRNLAYNTPPWNIIHQKLANIMRIKDEYKGLLKKLIEKYWSRARDIEKIPKL